MRPRARAWLAAVGLLTGGFPLAGGCSPGSEPVAERPFGVQLHVHGSMSEGPASMRAHAAAAAELGGAVDVIWWTDHDWRIAGHTYVSDFDFESGLVAYERAPAPLRRPVFDGREPLPAWAHRRDVGPDAPLESVERVRKGFRLRDGPRRETIARIEVTDREARSGRRSLRIGLEGPASGPDRMVLGFEASRRRHIASLASDVTLHLSLLPAVLEGDARLVVAVTLSQIRPGERARLDYVLVPGEGPPREPVVETRALGDGDERVRVATVAVPTRPGVWNDWVLPISDDAERAGLGGADNALVDLSIAVEASPAARFEAYVDALAIERDQLGPPLFAAERAMARELSTGALAHHVGQEISYAAHLNAYGADVPLTDPERFPHGMTPAEAVDWAHAHGGLVSLNHFFGTDFGMISHRFPRSREAFDASVGRLIAQRAYGVDLLEVGYRSRGHGLDAFLELWDGLSAAGVHVVGVGVSDSHDARTGWTSGPNNFVTWIWARSVAEADLLEGLRAGRAFFGDPTRFDGELDLRTEAGARMGDVVHVPSGPQRLALRVAGLRAGQSVRLIRDGRVAAKWPREGPALAVGATVEVSAPTFFRIEVVEEGEPVVLGNPIHFVPASADATQPGRERPAP